MVSETDNARQGFLTDERYSKLRDTLPDYLKPLFVIAYFSGVRLGELLAWKWDTEVRRLPALNHFVMAEQNTRSCRGISDAQSQGGSRNSWVTGVVP